MNNLRASVYITGTICVTIVSAAYSQPYTFTTDVGSSSNPGTADGTNSVASFTAPTGLAWETNGNLYVVDGNSIRTISTSGTNHIVKTQVGSINVHGFLDGANNAVRFNSPQDICSDSVGNLYIADTYNNAIRKATLNGTNWVVTTIAGPVPPSTVFGTADGTNNVARFHNPYGITIDGAGNLYVADTLNDTIREITPVGNNWVVTTIAGSGGNAGSVNATNKVSRFNNPTDVAVDAANNLYVADFANDTIRKLTLSGTNWVATTFAGAAGVDGSANAQGTNATFSFPQAIAIDLAQNLFISDSGNNMVRKVTPSGMVSAVAGTAGVFGSANGTGASAQFNQPYGIVVDPLGNLYVADYLGYAIRQGQPITQLTVTTSGQKCVLSWPATSSGFVPETSNHLPPTAWTPLPTNGVVLSNECFLLTNNLVAGAGFFRLHKQTP
jgi:hypothetical protein